jgi:hypothetical protein
VRRANPRDVLALRGQAAQGPLGKSRMPRGIWNAVDRDMNSDKPTSRGANQGEGDRVSARKYNRDVREFAKSGHVEPAARSAEAYVEAHPKEAARAERVAQRGSAAGGGVREIGHAVVERLRPIVRRAVGKLRARLRK